MKSAKKTNLKYETTLRENIIRNYKSLFIGLATCIVILVLIIKFLSISLPEVVTNYQVKEEDTFWTIIDPAQKLIIPSGDITSEAAQTNIPSSQMRTYEVKDGDNLWNIANTVYGNGNLWEKIAQANNLSKPDDLHTGDFLIIPN